MAGNTVSIKITAEDKASATLKNVGDNAEAAAKKTGGLGTSLATVGKVAGGFLIADGIKQLGGFLFSAASAAAADEQATARLEQSLRNAGGAFDQNLAKVNERIEAGGRLAFSDDDVRDSFQQLLAATNDTDEALKRQALAMDFARGAGIPLETATRLLGKVTAENVEVFKRMGITIGEGATEAEAFAVIQGKFAGQAETYAKSTAGQFDQAKIRMGELKEAIGSNLLPVMAKIGAVLVQDVIPKLEQFADWFKKNLLPELKEIGQSFAELVTTIKEEWDKIEPFVRPFLIWFETTTKMALQAISLALNILTGDWEGAVENLKAIWNELVTLVTGLAGSIRDMAAEIYAAASEIGRKILGGIKDGVGDLVKLGGELIDKLWNGIQGAFSAIYSKVYDAAYDLGKSIWNGVKAGLGKLWPFSPSEQGIKIGLGITDGMAVGVEQGLPTVTAAMNEITAAVARAAANIEGLFTPAMAAAARAAASIEAMFTEAMAAAARAAATANAWATQPGAADAVQAWNANLPTGPYTNPGGGASPVLIPGGASPGSSSLPVGFYDSNTKMTYLGENIGWVQGYIAPGQNLQDAINGATAMRPDANGVIQSTYGIGISSGTALWGGGGGDTRKPKAVSTVSADTPIIIALDGQVLARSTIREILRSGGSIPGLAAI